MPTECIIHKDKASTSAKSAEAPSSLHTLTRASWEKITEASEIRKKKKCYQSSIYKSIIDRLPSEMPIDGGYHSDCYKIFTAIPKLLTSSTVSKTATTKIHTLRSDVTDNKLRTSNTGVLEKCIWCKTLRRKVKGKWQLLTQALSPTQSHIKYYITELQPKVTSNIT